MEPMLDQQVVLVKGQHRYLFRYQEGSELAALDAFVALAANVQSDFDWFDAAVLSYQVSKNFHDPQEQDNAGWDQDYPETQEEYWP